MLSEENYNKLNENFLYKKAPKRDPNEMYIGCIPISYWCKNWTFKVKKYNGKALMYDTYWSTQKNYIEVTDNNINDFKVIFDITKVKQTLKEIVDEYNKEDIFCVAIDSGGISYPKYFVRKEAKKSKELQIEKKKEEIRKLKYKLENIERELNELINN